MTGRGIPKCLNSMIADFDFFARIYWSQTDNNIVAFVDL